MLQNYLIPRTRITEELWIIFCLKNRIVDEYKLINILFITCKGRDNVYNFENERDNIQIILSNNLSISNLYMCVFGVLFINVNNILVNRN